MIAFGFNSRGTDETWCIDTRGVLTLSIDPGTYQRLGLLGTPLPWRTHQNRYSTWTCLPHSWKRGMIFRIIAVVLSQNVPKGEKHWNPLGPKQKSALELYDNLREGAGFDAWDIVYHSKDNGTSELSGRGVCVYSCKVHSREWPISRTWFMSNHAKLLTSTFAFHMSAYRRHRTPTVKTMRIGKRPLMSSKNGLDLRVWVLNGKSSDPLLTLISSFERIVLTDVRVPIVYRRTIAWTLMSLRTFRPSQIPLGR